MPNLLKQEVMNIITVWCKTEKEPITLDYIASTIGEDIVSRNTIKATMRSLERSGFVRKAIRTKRTSYVKIRSL